MADYKTLAEIELEKPGYWQPTFTPGMAAQLRNIGGPIWSPDGRYLFYPQDFNGRTDLIRADTETGQLLQLTTDVEAGGLLRVAQSALDISPDGQSLIYMCGKDGKLWQIPSDGGVAKRLTTVGEGAQFSATFSPDGKRVAYIAMFGESQEIAVADSKSEGWPQRVSRGAHFVFDPQWMPDGQRVVFAEHDNQRLWYMATRLVVANVETGEQQILVDGWESFTYIHSARPSPDGKWLAYVSDESGWANIYLLNLESGQSQPFAPGTAEQAEPCWSPDSQGLAYTEFQSCNIGIRYTTLEGQTLVVAEGDGVNGAISFSADGQRLAYLKQSVDFPTNIFVYDFGKAESRQISHNSVGGLEKAGLVKAETVHWTSPDGLEIEGLMYSPAVIQPGKHPLLVHVHGGPISQYARRWDASVQYWVSRGWIVIEPNFRGSTGYGRTFRDKLTGTWGHEDMLDNIGAIDFANQLGLIDSSKVVAWGGSGGGYATMLLLGKWPELFKAGVALVGVSNFASFPDQTDRIARYLMQDLLGPRAENYKLYEERSPVSFAAQVQAPLLIMMGAEDKRVPAKQGEEMVEALKKAGKSNFEYVNYPGEGHGWRKVETILDYYSRMDKFLLNWVLER